MRTLLKFFAYVAHRKGGMLLAIPHSLIRDEVLTAGNGVESNDNLIGPSKVMSSKLEILEPDGNTVFLEDKYVVFWWRTSRMRSQPYDPLFEEYQHVVPFFESLPSAFPSMAGIADKVREWTSEIEASRAVFYSAREEPDGGGKAAQGAKKAPMKRVTNV